MAFPVNSVMDFYANNHKIFNNEVESFRIKELQIAIKK